MRSMTPREGRIFSPFCQNSCPYCFRVSPPPPVLLFGVLLRLSSTSQLRSLPPYPSTNHEGAASLSCFFLLIRLTPLNFFGFFDRKGSRGASFFFHGTLNPGDFADSTTRTFRSQGFFPLPFLCPAGSSPSLGLGSGCSFTVPPIHLVFFKVQSLQIRPF